MKNLIKQSINLIKGLKLLFLLGFVTSIISFVFQSCESEQYENCNVGIANQKFTKSLKEYKNTIGGISFSQASKNGKLNRLESNNGDITTYIDFPPNVSQQSISFYENVNSIQDLAYLIDNHDATLQYEQTSTNSNYQLNLPLAIIESSLEPLVQQSKEYLYTKGFTDSDIQQMITQENAEEIDLIPLVFAITQSENGKLITSNNYKFLPINIAYAKINWNQVGHCAMHALGVDVLFSLGASSATVWNSLAIRTAFKTVAKRMLGPIGVAIAVVDFGLCMGGAD